MEYKRVVSAPVSGTTRGYGVRPSDRPPTRAATEDLSGGPRVGRGQGDRLVRSPESAPPSDFLRLLLASAAAYAAVPTVGIILQWTVVEAYPATLPAHAMFGALSLALLGVSGTVPILAMAVFSGTLSDRFERRFLLRLANLLGLGAVAAIAVVLFLDPSRPIAIPLAAGFYVPEWFVLSLPLWAVVVVAAALARPTFYASVPQVVEAEGLTRANGQVLTVGLVLAGSSALAAGLMLGPLGPVLTLFLPLAFLEVTAVSLGTIERDLTGTRQLSGRTFRGDLVEGFRYLTGRTGLFEITLVSLALNFLGAMASVEIPLYVRDWLVQGPDVLGALAFAASIGSAVGCSAVSLVRYERRPGAFLAVCVVLDGASLLVFPFTHSTVAVLVALFAYGVLIGMVTTVLVVLIQRRVPDELLGRVFAADEVGSFALTPVGQYAGGILTAVRGLALTYTVTGAGVAGTGATMAGLRELHRFAAGTDAGAAAPGARASRRREVAPR